MKILEELYFGNLDADVQHYDRNSDVAKAMDTLVEVEDSQRLRDLDKFGKARLKHLHKTNFEYYKELFYNNKLVEHCEEISELAFKRSEEVQENYIERHPLLEDDFFERLAIRTMAQIIGDEIAMEEVIVV